MSISRRGTLRAAQLLAREKEALCERIMELEEAIEIALSMERREDAMTNLRKVLAKET